MLCAFVCKPSCKTALKKQHLELEISTLSGPFLLYCTVGGPCDLKATLGFFEIKEQTAVPHFSHVCGWAATV